MSTSTKFRRAVNDNFIWVLVVGTVAAAGLTTSGFLTINNGFNVLQAMGPLGCLVLAQSAVLLTGHFDLSTEANMVFVAVFGALLMVPAPAAGSVVAGGGYGWPWPLALVIMLGTAALVGLVNGLIIVKLRMNAFMVTLSTSIILGGLVLVVGQARNLLGVPSGFRFIGSEMLGRLPVSGLFVLGLFVVAHLILTRTVAGRHLYAIGSNRQAARAAGLNDDRSIIGAFVTSGLLAGTAAFLLVGRLGSASPGISSGLLFLSVAAAVVGGVSLAGGQGTASGMLGGLLLISVISNAMNLAAIPSQWIRVVSGVIILLAVFIDATRLRMVGRASWRRAMRAPTPEPVQGTP